MACDSWNLQKKSAEFVEESTESKRLVHEEAEDGPWRQLLPWKCG